MRQPIPEVVFISACLAGNSEGENVRRSNILRMMLKENNFKFREAVGYYKNVEKISFMVWINDHIDIDTLLNLAKDNFNQECIMYRNDLKKTYTINCNSNIKKFIGITDTITRRQAVELDDYTYFPSTKQYLGVVS